MAETLESFNHLLTKAQDLFLEENCLLKAGKLAEHTALMEKKEELLKELDEGLTALKLMKDGKSKSDKDSMRALQDRIMRLLMLDKENEQLLLKQSVGNFQGSPKVSTQIFEKFYKKP